MNSLGCRFARTGHIHAAAADDPIGPCSHEPVRLTRCRQLHLRLFPRLVDGYGSSSNEPGLVSDPVQIICRPAHLPAGHTCRQRRRDTARNKTAGRKLADAPLRWSERPVHGPGGPVPRVAPDTRPGKTRENAFVLARAVQGNSLRSRERRFESCRGHWSEA